MNTNDFFDSLWSKYTQITPQAQRIQSLFQDQGETVLNDHVAFRTFNNSPIELEKLEPQLSALGYKAYGAFRFENKHLKARCYKHESDTLAPKIFLSELITEELPAVCQEIITKLTEQIALNAVQSPDIFWAGTLWDKISEEDYLTLAEHSEYAAWLSTMGLQANHFTVSINHLKKFPTIEEVNSLLQNEGYTLNSVGGIVKGSPQLYLEQSSTMADKVEVTFANDIKRTIPSCFYEFAKRHKQPDGVLFDSFIEGNADKIFDSTNAQ
ncbi:DUF1338 domain-containing protein [Marinomonas mediterranea]|jgi:hypothetical protein|uniref:2-oxoadipate dioxygenase/decarboxylase n=1 Tax=Marinomonas mediterranea (strain ATCC 700492 / JCM 21426 / NBRC 103028 / MMB-1) TaxID=717774 RepID=F2JUD9_MARM1|nr:DUF1338 domain-containing protein [Marinomonas mediterranea]ADZ92758.1 hypothetical protein Marme_3545 [Marinomonas mediterranea MMB-1]WCN10687.1 DUF1338 family protein [Marinomonas mediterranea]WCN14744.1 DUF1338 family protein [Marinomonas mediterranea]WCN18785.1 DUF1338 family protein [Marinomonas mediterranea MMB-1]